MSLQPSKDDPSAAHVLAERLRLAEQVGKIGIWEWDITANHLTWSEEVYRIHGKDPASFVPSYESWQAIVHPEDRAYVLSSIGETLHARKEYYVEFRVVWSDGSIHWLTTRGGAEYDVQGRPVRMIGLTFDVTDRKLAEEALLRKEQELRIITDALPLQIAYIDRDLRYRFVNRTYEAWTNRPARELLGKPVQEVVGEEAYAKVSVYMMRALAGEEAFFETDLAPGNGSIRQIQGSYIPDHDPAGQVQGFFAMEQDVTGQRRAEQALRRAEKLAAAGRLAATIAHELNNPLEAITNLVFLATADPEASPGMRHYLSLAEQELRRVHHLVNQTLGFYRDLSRPTDVDFQKLVASVVSVHARKVEARGAQIRVQIDPGVRLHGVAGELTQVLSNLVSNALDAVSTGGIVRIEVRSGGRADVRIFVADNGKGIPREDCPRLFEPFFTTKSDVGTGLGLWVTKEIVEKHGGRIRFRSRTHGRRQGTLFSINLPSEWAAALQEVAEEKKAAGY
jgi:PAS domain S-box-containing protein